jgi:hypothetical protein
MKDIDNGYCIEVLKRNPHGSERIALYSHHGYMQIIFKTKESAREYHDRHCPRMRRINQHGDDVSDWDPVTELGYTIRNHHGCVEMTIPPFDLNDAPVITKYPSGAREINYKVI